jgi:ParB family chromosome partitioning protein
MGARKPITPLKNFDDIFGGGNKQHEITMITLDSLYAFKDHPFKVLDDSDMEELKESISSEGVMNPILIRPRESGGYEIIAGHRRQRACELIGLREIPAIIKDMDDDTAIAYMVDTNLQRTRVLLSEKAYAYKMRMEALRRRSGDAVQSEPGGESLDILAETSSDSRAQIARFIRLTNLNTELLEMTDEIKIPFTAAVEISYLNGSEQSDLHHILLAKETTADGKSISLLSHAQAVKLRSLSGDLGYSDILEIIVKNPKQSRSVTIPEKKLAEYFPDTYTREQIMEEVLAMLEARKIS